MATKGNKQVEDDAIQSASDVAEIGSILEFSEDVSEQDRPEPLPAGEYPFSVIGAKIHTSKESGKKSLALSVQIAADDMPPDYVTKYQVESKTMVKYIGCVADTPQSRYNLKTLCQNLQQPLPGRSFDPNTLTGASGKIVVTHDDDLEGNKVERPGRILKN